MKVQSSLIGDWMGTEFGASGRRTDYRLFLNHDGRYERSIHSGPNYERQDTGNWSHDEEEKVLHLDSETPDDLDRISSKWRVLSVHTCEDSNCIMVLRWSALASRNLPILFYRVHGDGRAYGEGWQDRLEAPTKES